MRKHFTLGLLLVLALLSGCKTSSLSLRVLKPAAITVPISIQSLVVTNRSIAADDKRVVNVIEGILTGEAIFADRMGSIRCVEGANAALSGSPRYNLKLYQGPELRGTGIRQFPVPLDWAMIEDICRRHEADALVTLEVFDSNSAIARKVVNTKKTIEGKEQVITEHVARLDVTIEAGWRIYYPATRSIIDQNIYNDRMNWERKGRNPELAEAALPPMHDAIKDAGYFAGQQFAKRISPLWTWVSREYYKKGNDDFKAARRMVQVDDWDGARALWEKHASNPDPKIAGYAHYNLAVAAEVFGQLDEALEYTRVAYTRYGNKKARDYSRAIQRRISDQRKLDQQMELPE